MPRMSEMLPSKYIKKEEVETPVLATVSGVKAYDVSLQNDAPKMRYCLEFQETTPPLNKPMVLNATKMGVLKAMTGSENSDDWIGIKVVVWHDPSIMFGADQVGGTALRAPKNPQSQVPADAMDHMQQPHANDVPDDEIPFS